MRLRCATARCSGAFLSERAERLPRESCLEEGSLVRILCSCAWRACSAPAKPSQGLEALAVAPACTLVLRFNQSVSHLCLHYYAGNSGASDEVVWCCRLSGLYSRRE